MIDPQQYRQEKDPAGPARFIYPIVMVPVMLVWLDHFPAERKWVPALILSLVGVAIGAALYFVVRKQSPPLIYGGVVLLFIVSLGSHATSRNQRERKKNEVDWISLMQNYNSEQNKKPEAAPRKGAGGASEYEDPTAGLTDEEIASLQTCEVCGYMALLPGEDACRNCFYITYENAGDERPSSKKEWLRDSQREWFRNDGAWEFYEPATLHGFKKDPSWEPSITTRDLLEIYE